MNRIRLARLLAPLVALAALAVAPSALAQSDPAVPERYEDLLDTAREDGSVRVLVATDGMLDRSLVQNAADAAGGEILTRYRNLPILLVEAPPAALVQLAQSPFVLGLEEDVPEPATLASTLPLINGDDVHGFGYDGDGTAVAILDTGIDADHPFFAGRIVSQACFSNAGGAGGGASICAGGGTAETAAGSANIETAACMDGTVNICDHGSHVAGIAAGEATGAAGAPGDGVAPGADIIAINVFTRFNAAADCSPNPAPCVSSFPSDQVLALDRVLALDGTLASDIVSVNMSLGAGMFAANCDGDNQGRKAAIDALLAEEIATVISAGNNGFNAAVGRPGCISTAVTVGATTDADAVAGFSNRGVLLDLFAPGVGVDSSVPDDTWANFDGTSMSAPHVTGAWGVLREMYPSATVATILGWLQANGQAITYMSGGSNVTTPRIDLLATVQPDLAADNASVTVDEGQTAANSGTFGDPNGDAVTLSASVGTVVAGAGTWSWSFDAVDGPADSQVVTITATDALGIENEVTFALTVNNVLPSVTGDPAQETAIDEGDVLSVLSFFSDPGYLDNPYSATVDWGHPDLGTSPGSILMTQDAGPGPDQGEVSASKAYGDNGAFTVSTAVTDKDGGTGSTSFGLTVANVAPTAAIDLSGTILVNGVPTLVGDVDGPVDFAATASDPGSDDLEFDWDFGDGNSATGVSLVNDPLFDPLPSPTLQPRVNVGDAQSHQYLEACTYETTLDVTDDDGGASPTDTVAVLVTGNAVASRPTGWWHGQYMHGGFVADFTVPTLECYLAIARFGSTVFDEAVPLATLADADAVLQPSGGADAHLAHLDRELLTAWLNFANGVFDYGQPVVDTDKDGAPDLAFSDVMAAAEAVRLDAGATKKELGDQRHIVQEVNRFG
jgi:subtilisin family serine protease